MTIATLTTVHPRRKTDHLSITINVDKETTGTGPRRAVQQVLSRSLWTQTLANVRDQSAMYTLLPTLDETFGASAIVSLLPAAAPLHMRGPTLAAAPPVSPRLSFELLKPSFYKVGSSVNVSPYVGGSTYCVVKIAFKGRDFKCLLNIKFIFV